MYEKEKREFALALKSFAASLEQSVTADDEWTIKGFIDVFQRIYPVSTDTKVISKVLELHIFPRFLNFADENGYRLEPASCQNWYPDLTFIRRENEAVKFAVDLKTTYRDEAYPGFCNGFTLGSHGEYFVNRESRKNIQYPYNQYSGHFCLGIIYSRAVRNPMEDMKSYSVRELHSIPSVIRQFTFFSEEKWKIASDKGGSGNTANIGSIQKIDDILKGNGVFANAGEEIFDDYWANFGVLQIPIGQGRHKKLSSLSEYLEYRGLPASLNNPRASRRKRNAGE